MESNRFEILMPGSTWKSKSDTYIHARLVKENTKVQIDSLQINVEDAFVIFNIDSYRTMLEANRFRKMFERSTT